MILAFSAPHLGTPGGIALPPSAATEFVKAAKKVNHVLGGWTKYLHLHQGSKFAGVRESETPKIPDGLSKF